jgi:hypothetical protein
MQKLTPPGREFFPVDIEYRFPGLRYFKAEGMYNVGESKNIYTEDYAESDALRYYLPKDGVYTNKATVINMTFLVLGGDEQRRTTIDSFVEYIRQGAHSYWDNARKRMFAFVVLGEIKESDEKWYGTQPYVELTIPMQNIEGHTTLVYEVGGMAPVYGDGIVVTSIINPTLQQGLHNAGYSASEDKTTVYEAIEVPNINFAIGSGSQIEHLAEINYFINMQMTTLDLRNCTQLGSISTPLLLEDGRADYVNVLPSKESELSIGFQEIDMRNTKLKGVNLQRGATLRTIRYSNYTKEVVLKGQSSLTTVTIPTSAGANIDRIEIEGCNELEEITWT